MNIEKINTDFLDRVIRGEIEDHWYHYGLSSSDPMLEKMHDVKAIILSGSGERINKFADSWARLKGKKILSLPKEDRFVFRYVDRVIFSSHGMGMPSAAIAMHELMKITYFLKKGDLPVLNNLLWMRVGTSGGIGLSPGTLVVSTEGLQPDGKPYRVFSCNEEYYFDGKFPARLASTIMETAQRLGVEAIQGKTIGCNDFYLEQGRLDGAIRLTDECGKLSWLNSLYELGIRNIEMETPMFAGLLNYWGFSRFGAICSVLLNRLNGDQVSATQEELGQYVENAEKVLLGCLDELI